MSHYQHETAVVDVGDRIGEGSRVWHFVHVCGGPRIGAVAKRVMSLPMHPYLDGVAIEQVVGAVVASVPVHPVHS